MMKRFEVRDGNVVEKEIDETISEFEKTMENLKSYGENTEQLKFQLEKVEGAWERFLSSINNKEIDKTIDLNGEVLIEMDKAVNLYERLFLKLRRKNAYAG